MTTPPCTQKTATASLVSMGRMLKSKTRDETRSVKGGGTTMPLFDYQCVKCGHTFEKYIPDEGKKSQFCPQCGYPAVRKPVQSPGFRTDHTWD